MISINIVFWVATPYDLRDINFSEEHTASIFRVTDGGIIFRHAAGSQGIATRKARVDVFTAVRN
jgi:hypothetical protein